MREPIGLSLLPPEANGLAGAPLLHNWMLVDKQKLAVNWPTESALFMQEAQAMAKLNCNLWIITPMFNSVYIHRLQLCRRVCVALVLQSERNLLALRSDEMCGPDELRESRPLGSLGGYKSLV